MKSVQVLLSCYNGEKYVAEQIESIMNQKGVNVKLLIRDDGSTDNTCQIVKKYADNESNIQFYKGKNIGVQKSFFQLLNQVDVQMDYYAFADQDDFWLEEKLQRAITCLELCEDSDKPLLYASKVIYADETLENLEQFSYEVKRVPSFGNALLENICIGCTEVFNGKLRYIAANHQPQSDILHDWWFYMTASCFGTVFFDEEAYIYYRQHQNNQIGMNNKWLGRWKRRIRNFGKIKGLIRRQAQDFYRSYGDLGEYDTITKQIINYKDNVRNRYKISRQKEIYRQNKVDDIVYRLLFFAGFL